MRSTAPVETRRAFCGRIIPTSLIQVWEYSTLRSLHANGRAKTTSNPPPMPRAGPFFCNFNRPVAALWIMRQRAVDAQAQKNRAQPADFLRSEVFFRITTPSAIETMKYFHVRITCRTRCQLMSLSANSVLVSSGENFFALAVQNSSTGRHTYRIARQFVFFEYCHLCQIESHRQDGHGFKVL
jgi:hypothetical protein